MLDIISLLLEPTNGEILLDGKKILGQEKSWQEKISYVPQNVYLSENGIINNIVVDNEETIDLRKINKVCNNLIKVLKVVN